MLAAPSACVVRMHKPDWIMVTWYAWTLFLAVAFFYVAFFAR